MSVLNQKTINRDIIFKGVGLHSGANVTMTVKPAKPNSGILFKRVDLKENNIVVPNIFNVSSAVFCTTIANESGVSISTIEHLMGALYGLGIDNALIEIDNQEVPILDELSPLETLVDELWGGISSAVSYGGYDTLTNFIGNCFFEIKQNSLPPRRG